MSFKSCTGALALLLAWFAFIAVANADSSESQELHWKTVLGLTEAGDVVGVGSGALTGAAPWATQGGSVHVNLGNGHVSFDVRGLILTVGSVFELGGNDFSKPPLSGVPIGTTGPITSVTGSLVCNVTGDQGANSVSVDTLPSTLDSEGNAHFNGQFTGPIPSQCSTNPTRDNAFLIRIGNGPFTGLWIAFGAIPTLD